MEEQVVCKNVGKRAYNIRVMFYLTEAGLYVFGVDDDVVHGVQDPEVVRPGTEFFADATEFALEF